jgi:uncharacterized protein (TIGR03437 family)
MDLSVLKRRSVQSLGGLLALTACAGSMQAANNLLAYTVSGAVTCNTATGPGSAQTILVKAAPTLASTSNVITVTFTPPTAAGLVVTAPSAVVLNSANQAAGITFTVNAVPGCVNVGAGTVANSVQFRSVQAGTVVTLANDNVATVSTTLTTAAASGLVAAGVTVTCARDPNAGSPLYYPGPPQTVSVTSAATGGIPFTVDASSIAWLTAGTPSGASAGVAPVTFTVAPTGTCGSNPALGTSNAGSIHLISGGGGPDKLVAVTLQVIPLTPLVATPNPASLSYVKGSGTAGYAAVNITSATVPSPFFAVDTSTLPIWLTVDLTTGTATVAGKSIRFTSTSVADTLPPGTYSATVRIKVAFSADLSIPITLLVNNKAPKLSVSSTETTTRNLTWAPGSSLPTPVITLLSSDSPIAYTATTAGTLKPAVSAAQQKGLAYSFGTQVGITFDPLIFAAAQPGSVLTGTVTFNWGTPTSTIVVTFNVTILSPGASVSGISPASIPTATSGTFHVILTGTGFVGGTDLSLKTKVGIIVGGLLPNGVGTIVTDTNIAVTVINPSNIDLVITVPAGGDVNLPFDPTKSGGSVMFGVCNPGGLTCNTAPASATVALNIGAGPIIQAVTSASTFLQVTPPAVPSMAPYDMISIFGANFCSSGGTGCGNTTLIYGSPDANSLRFPLTLPGPELAGAANPRSLSVTFYAHNSTTLLGTAPLLFATTSQINALVPAALAGHTGVGAVDIVVNFGYGLLSAATMLKSIPFPVTIVATDPGIFTVGADGQGDGAILAPNYSLVSATNPAGMRSTGADSDYIQLYVTGLGVPDSTAANTAATASVPPYPGDCISVAAYYNALNAVTAPTTTWSDVDGAVIQSWLLKLNKLPPCIATANIPTVAVGGVAGTVTYAGFVADSIAGLYQINVTLPGTSGGTFVPLTGPSVTKIVQPIQLPVQITSNGVTSQNGVTVWVTPRLKVVAPTYLEGPVGIAWSVDTAVNSVVASEGFASTYHYALTSGVLPSGLVLGAADGTITGKPAANTAGTYTVTVTATDTAAIPVTGSVTFDIVIDGGLYMTLTAGSNVAGVFGTASNLTPGVTATGGASPYVYTITAPSPVPDGLLVNSSGRVGSSVQTPAGTYTVTVTATDKSGTLTGTATSDVVIGLKMAFSPPVTTSIGTNPTGILTTVTATGNTDELTYTFDAAGLASNLAIDSSGNITIGTAIAGTYTIKVTATDAGSAPGAKSATYATGTTTTITVIVAP